MGLAALALVVGGCDAEDASRPQGGYDAANGKADEYDDGVAEVLGTTSVKVTLTNDLFSERVGEAVEHAVYVNGRAVPVNDWADVEYTGRDCVRVVSKNPAVREFGQPTEFITERCDYDLTPDPERINNDLIHVQMVKFDLGFDTNVDFGWGFERLGLSGSNIAGGDSVVVGEGLTYLMLPGEYMLALGAYDELDAPEEWQTFELFIDEVDDFADGMSLVDQRTQLVIDPPRTPSSLPLARAKSGCALETDIWVTWATGNRSYGRELDETETLYFMPYPGAHYSVRVGGIVARDVWDDENGVAYYDVYVDTFAHDVPVGPNGEGGHYSIWMADDPEARVKCFDGMQFGSNSTFEVGTHVILPTGTYVEEIAYDGMEPSRREFTLGG